MRVSRTRELRAGSGRSCRYAMSEPDLAVVSPAMRITLVVIAGLIVAGSALGYVHASTSRADREALVRATARTERLDALESAVKDAERGQRGYLLTGDPAFLAPYDAALQGTAPASFPTRLDAVERSFEGEPADQRSLARVRTLVQSRLAQLQSNVALYDSGRRDEAVARIRTAEGLRTMEALHAEIAERTRTDRAHIDARRVAAEGAARTIMLTSLASSGLALLVLVAFAVAMRRAEDRVARDEERLVQSEARLRLVLDNLYAFVAILDLDGTLLETNQAPYDASGLAREDVLGKPFWRGAWWGYDDAVRERLRAGVERARAGETVRYDVIALMKGNEPRTVDLQLAPLRDEGRITHVVASGVDVEARKRTEAALRASEARAREAAAQADAERRLLDATFDAAPVGIVVADASGRLLRMNRANERLWGMAPYSESIDEHREWKGWWADGSARHGRRVAPEDWALARALRGEVCSGDVIEIEPFGAPDDRRVMINSGAPVRDSEGRVVGGVVAQADITDRIAIEHALRESEERFRALADNIPQLAWIGDAAGNVSWFNRRWTEYTGLSIEQSTNSGYRVAHHPDHLRRVEAKFRACVETGEGWEDTFPIRRHDGEYNWFLSRAVPIRDDTGHVVRWFGTNTDVTQQLLTERALRESEERLLAREVALREADRQKDEFLATLAHELRNPLAPIRTAAQVIKARSPDDPALNRAREAIERQSAHLARLVDDLLDVSRISFGNLALHEAPCELGAVIGSAIETARPSIDRAGHRFEVRIADPSVVLEVDAARIAQAIANLLQNAVKFTNPPGHIELIAEVRDGMVVVRVRDDGVGIAPPMLERIFGMFVQGRRSGFGGNSGLGIGLALTRKVVELHGGEVLARSGGEGRGSEFEIRLPLPHAARHPATEVPLAIARSTARVLVVDDNDDAATLLHEMLSLDGHEVFVAHDGRSALERFERDRPDVVLLDIGLPDMTGYDVAERIRAVERPVPPLLVALTGWGQASDRDRARRAGFDVHVTKPADPDRLRAIVADHLGAARRPDDLQIEA